MSSLFVNWLNWLWPLTSVQAKRRSIGTTKQRPLSGDETPNMLTMIFLATASGWMSRVLGHSPATNHQLRWNQCSFRDSAYLDRTVQILWALTVSTNQTVIMHQIVGQIVLRDGQFDSQFCLIVQPEHFFAYNYILIYNGHLYEIHTCALFIFNRLSTFFVNVFGFFSLTNYIPIKD